MHLSPFLRVWTIPCHFSPLINTSTGNWPVCRMRSSFEIFSGHKDYAIRYWSSSASRSPPLAVPIGAFSSLRSWIRSPPSWGGAETIESDVSTSLASHNQKTTPKSTADRNLVDIIKYSLPISWDLIDLLAASAFGKCATKVKVGEAVVNLLPLLLRFPRLCFPITSSNRAHLGRQNCHS